MSIAEKIINLMKHRAEAYTLKRVQIGLIYSAVELDCSATGVAYTFPKKTPCGPQMLYSLKPTTRLIVEVKNILFKNMDIP